MDLLSNASPTVHFGSRRSFSFLSSSKDCEPDLSLRIGLTQKRSNRLFTPLHMANETTTSISVKRYKSNETVRILRSKGFGFIPYETIVRCSCLSSRTSDHRSRSPIMFIPPYFVSLLVVLSFVLLFDFPSFCRFLLHRFHSLQTLSLSLSFCTTPWPLVFSGVSERKQRKRKYELTTSRTENEINPRAHPPLDKLEFSNRYQAQILPQRSLFRSRRFTREILLNAPCLITPICRDRKLINHS